MPTKSTSPPAPSRRDESPRGDTAAPLVARQRVRYDNRNMALQVKWLEYKTEACTGRMALVGSYLISEASGFLDGPLAKMMVRLCEPVFERGESLGSFHLWETKSYEPAFRTVWTDCMKKWGTKHFRDLNVYVPTGLARMGLSVAAALRIGEVVVYKSKGELLQKRLQVVGI